MGTLKATLLPITMGLLCRLEDILGTETVNRLQTDHIADVTMAQRRRMLVEVFEYGEDEVDEITNELVEEELTCFFLRWLGSSLSGKLRSTVSAHTTTTSPTETVPSAMRSGQNRSRRKTARSK